MASVDSLTDVDPRPGWLRALLALGIVLLLAIGLPMLVLGLLLVREQAGPFVLCLGLLLSALGLGGVVREVVERSHRRDPPVPRLKVLDGGESALFLPRAAGPSLVSAWSLVALAVVCLLGASFAGAAGRWVFAVLLLVVAVACLVVAQPLRARSLVGGLGFTPQRIVHEHDGVRWEVPWADVHGAVPQEPMPLLVHQGRLPEVHRTWVAGRHRGRAVIDGVLVVETRYLAGGAVLAAYVVEKALVDPAFRAALGSPASLPPS